MNDLLQSFESFEPGNVGHDPSLSQRRLSFIANRVDVEKEHIQTGSISTVNQYVSIVDIPNEIQSIFHQNNTTSGTSTPNMISSFTNRQIFTMQIDCIIHDILSTDLMNM